MRGPFAFWEGLAPGTHTFFPFQDGSPLGCRCVRVVHLRANCCTSTVGRSHQCHRMGVYGWLKSLAVRISYMRLIAPFTQWQEACFGCQHSTSYFVRCIAAHTAFSALAKPTLWGCPAPTPIVLLRPSLVPCCMFISSPLGLSSTVRTPAASCVRLSRHLVPSLHPSPLLRRGCTQPSQPFGTGCALCQYNEALRPARSAGGSLRLAPSRRSTLRASLTRSTGSSRGHVNRYHRNSRPCYTSLALRAQEVRHCCGPTSLMRSKPVAQLTAHHEPVVRTHPPR